MKGHLAILLLACAAAPLAAQNLPPSGLTAWPQSKPLIFWTRNATPYPGPVQDVFIGDTRFGASPGYPDAVAYTNLWTLRAEWEHDPSVLTRSTIFDLEKLRYDLLHTAIVGLGTGGVADGYDARRKLIDCRRPESALWIRAEAQRLISGGFRRVFFDNTMMKATGFFTPLNAQTAVNDAENALSMAAGTRVFREECERFHRPMEMIVNLAQSWHWTGARNVEDANQQIVTFWWDLGVRGVLLEKPEARDPASAAYKSNVNLGKLWLAKGGNLYVILEDEAAGAAMAKELDGERTWVWVRPK